MKPKIFVVSRGLAANLGKPIKTKEESFKNKKEEFISDELICKAMRQNLI